MGYNKVVDKNNNILLDLSGDTVTANRLLNGFTAHNADGDVIIGTIQVYNGEIITPEKA